MEAKISDFPWGKFVDPTQTSRHSDNVYTFTQPFYILWAVLIGLGGGLVFFFLSLARYMRSRVRYHQQRDANKLVSDTMNSEGPYVFSRKGDLTLKGVIIQPPDDFELLQEDINLPTVFGFQNAALDGTWLYLDLGDTVGTRHEGIPEFKMVEGPEEEEEDTDIHDQKFQKLQELHQLYSAEITENDLDPIDVAPLGTVDPAPPPEASSALIELPDQPPAEPLPPVLIAVNEQVKKEEERIKREQNLKRQKERTARSSQIITYIKENKLTACAKTLDGLDLLLEGIVSDAMIGPINGQRKFIKVFTLPTSISKVESNKIIALTKQLKTKIRPPMLTSNSEILLELIKDAHTPRPCSPALVAVGLNPIHFVYDVAGVESVYDHIHIRTEPMQWVQKLRLITKIASLIQKLHGESPPVVHGDLRSSHILIGQSNDLSLCGWTSSRLIRLKYGMIVTPSNSPAAPSGRTNEKILQNPINKRAASSWAAPEVLAFEQGFPKNQQNPGETIAPYVPPPFLYSTATDIFSYGMIMYEILTEQEPWPTLSEKAIIEKVTKGDFQQLALQLSRQPGILVKLIQSCWNVNPEERPTISHCTDVLKEILKLQKKEPRE
ncbi:putative Protein tyrosine kinase [Blattamonas nauphoetae]|uniref:Protein kinase domain-containing protein n=1 Tax=Blattamonas nauphoetae TaxID=2049346 RepID=A0ABQ9XZ40_9EUKA|nr:putative Protein tyrosine kinase [Blattamonas nauphoetae]